MVGRCVGAERCARQAQLAARVRFLRGSGKYRTDYLVKTVGGREKRQYLIAPQWPTLANSLLVTQIGTAAQRRKGESRHDDSSWVIGCVLRRLNYGGATKTRKCHRVGCLHASWPLLHHVMPPQNRRKIGEAQYAISETMGPMAPVREFATPLPDSTPSTAGLFAQG